MKRTEVSSLGEFGLIDRITENFENRNQSTIVGVGDDAAVLSYDKPNVILSTDMLLEGIHFDLSYMPLQHLGFKAVSVNVSDIAAMNAEPKQITVNIGLSNRFSVEAVEALYSGIRAACKEFKIDLVGGDTTASKTGLVISVSIVGEADENKIVKRKGTKPSDIVCATGDLGAAFIGLQVLEREKQVFLSNPDMKPELGEYTYIVQRQLKPVARMDIIYELAEMNIVPTAMIDISDGLASELFHLRKHSNVGFQIFEDKLPIDKKTFDTAVEFKIDPITCVLNGGEDYELLFTIKQLDFEKLKNHPDIHFIGYAQDIEKGMTLVTKGQNVIPLQAQGWNHLKNNQQNR